MPALLASDVMDLAAAALNDADKTVYNYETQIPYLKMALQELQEIFALNSLPITEQTSATIPITDSISELEFDASGPLRLPDNLIEIQKIYQWSNSFWSPVARSNWTWKNNKLRFSSPYANSEIRIDYIGSLFPKFLHEDTILPVQTAQGYLAYKTAELISDMVEHNADRARSNGGRAEMSLDRVNGITIKTKQRIVARRRPFRSNYKRAIIG